MKMLILNRNSKTKRLQKIYKKNRDICSRTYIRNNLHDVESVSVLDLCTRVRIEILTTTRKCRSRERVRETREIERER